MLKTKFTLSRTLIVYIQLFANIMIVKLLEGSLKLISFSLFLKITMNASRIPVIRWQVVVTVLDVTRANAGLVTREMAPTARVRYKINEVLTLHGEA